MRLKTVSFHLKDGRTCTLRSPLPADAERIVRFLRLVNGETDYLTRYPDEIRLTAEQEAIFLQNALDDPRGAMLCAFVDGDVASLASFGPVGMQARFAHRCTFGISVAKAYWRQGIGGAVTARIIDAAKNAAYTQMELEVVSTNAPAIRLYERFGFQRCGVLPKAFRYRDGSTADEDLMVLDFTN